MGEIVKKILIIGAFDFKKMDTGGQPVKTRELYYALLDYYKSDCIKVCDTAHWKRNPFGPLLFLLKLVRKMDVVIMLPAQKGLTVISRILLLLANKKTKLIYDVIGGWLPGLLEKNKTIKKMLYNFNQIWVETESMKEALNTLGFSNVYKVHNFKNISIVGENDLDCNIQIPLMLCFFARVRPEKGIEDAISVIKRINEEEKRIVFCLDVYGLIEDEYKARFETLLDNNNSFVKYCGVAKPSDGVEIIRNYFALLFPTRFYTEGVPGTLIDSYCAGVPVITSVWKNAKDIFIDGITGWGFNFGDIDDFYLVLKKVLLAPKAFIKMKKSTLEEGKKYLTKNVVSHIVTLIEE